MICMFIRYVPNHLIILIQNDISVMCVMHVIRVKRSIPFPSVIVLSVMRDILLMHVMHIMRPPLSSNKVGAGSYTCDSCYACYTRCEVRPFSFYYHYYECYVCYACCSL